jgi:hypothetical protein
MPLADDIEEFRRKVDKAVEELEKARAVSDGLTECTVDEMHRQLIQLQDLCEQASIEIKQAGVRLLEINARWGSEPLEKYLGEKNQQEVIEKRGGNLIALAMAKGVRGGSGLTDVFQELAEYRQQLGLPTAGSESDRATVAKLEIGENGFFGISSLPNAENAIVDIRKLQDYCLNPEHKDGKHKAKLFSAILGMTAADAEELRQILLEIVKTHEVKLGRQDEFGQRYTLDFEISWQNRKARLRSGWIIEPDSEIPKLTTCYPL